jgi:hypothetical protein
MPFAMGRVPPLASPFPESEEIIDLFGEKRYALQILLVENSPRDVRRTQEAFREANSSIQL